jgi:hypothetical protein
MNIGGASSETEPNSAALRRVQALLVRLYFSDALQRRYLDDPERLFSQLGLSGRFRGCFPDVASPDFIAECRGRRFLVAKEIAARYLRTFEVLLPDVPDPGPARSNYIAESDLFSRFLASEHFLGRSRSLPSAAGIGIGYEGVSKFFFWLDEICGLSLPDAPSELRVRAFVEFGRQLVAVSKISRDPFFAESKAGVFFRPAPEGESRIVITPELAVALEAQPGPPAGLVDLDALVARVKSGFPARPALARRDL